MNGSLDFDIEIGIFTLSTIYEWENFDIVDCLTAVLDFAPENYIPSRECYFWL